MKIFTAQQIRQGDRYTMDHEPIQSIDLMEKAARQCAQWLQSHFYKETRFYIFCGVGNNAGDGFALARLLSEKGYQTQTFIIRFSDHFSEDCDINKKKLEELFPDRVHNIHSPEEFPPIPTKTVLIDALFGTGLNRPLKGLVKDVVLKMNTVSQPVIAIDMPSGLRAESNTVDKTAIHADHTLSFEFHKLAFFFKENAAFVGQVHLLSIGIHPDYIQHTLTPYHLITSTDIASRLSKRSPFSHKGTYGHALIVAGSHGKMGAAILATRANIKSGAGLTTVYCPACGYTILQTAVPEAMCLTDHEERFLSNLPEEDTHEKVIGVGPGIGTRSETVEALTAFMNKKIPMVLDADALNIIAQHPALLPNIPQGSILTPHPKEFERLFGSTEHSYQRLQLQREKSKALQVTILLKGHHTSITSPKGQVWFNATGHAGMATGGSGDVLTGLIAGLLAQEYSAPQAAILGAWIHGKAAELSLHNESMESMTAGSIISFLGEAFKQGHRPTNAPDDRLQ